MKIWTASAKAVIFLFLQAIVILMYGLFTDYAVEVQAGATYSERTKDSVQQYYPMFQDVHVMIFVGFGFLMVFLKAHSWTSVGYNFLVATWTIQITILMIGFWEKCFHGFTEKIHLSITSLIVGDFGAGAVLISFGALLGKLNSFQLLVMACIEIFFYSLNEEIGVAVYYAVDMGGSMYVHTFGAIFGIFCSWVYQNSGRKPDRRTLMEGTHHSQLFAMIGTLFLWMYWPSFNGALAEGNAQHRVIVNTVLALCASALGAFLTSALTHHGKLDMEDILNATLAGGVIIGSSSDLVVHGFVSMIIGLFGGIISALGFRFLSPALDKFLKLHDTCGVINLHGVPGILGGLIGALSSGFASDVVYGDDISTIFPKRGGVNGRTSWQQCGYQLAALGTTILIAAFGGLLTGAIFRIPFIWGTPEDIYNDEAFWHIEHEDTEAKSNIRDETQKADEEAKQNNSQH